MKPKQQVIGYRVTTDVTLKLKDFTKVGPITQQLADANVSETQTLSYTLENMDDAKNKAVEDAYRRARNSADTSGARQRPDGWVSSRMLRSTHLRIRGS